MSKFKKGDKVRFKSPDSRNATYFSSGLRNLEIVESLGISEYSVREADNSISWCVEEYELELETPKFKSWRKRYDHLQTQ